MANGKIILFKADRGYGFIEAEDGSPNVYLHKSEIEKAGVSEIEVGQRVEYELHTQDDKVSAVNIKLLD